MTRTLSTWFQRRKIKIVEKSTQQSKIELKDEEEMTQNRKYEKKGVEEEETEESME